MSKAVVVVEGFVARDPELRRTGSGKAVLQVTVPHQRSKPKDGGGFENVGETTWWTATFWEAEAEAFAQLVRKGSKVIVQGQPEISTFQKNDGTVGVRAEILFATMGLVPRPGQRQQSTAPAEAAWGGPPQQTYAPGQNAATQGDVWGAPAGGTYNDETPF